MVRGPAATAQVTFSRHAAQVTMVVSCSAGVPSATTQAEAPGGGGDNGGGGGGGNSGPGVVAAAGAEAAGTAEPVTGAGR